MSRHGAARGYRPQTFVYPNGRTIAYNYDDNLNRLSSIEYSTADGTGSTQTTYDYLGLDTIVKETSLEPDVGLDYTGGSHDYSGLNQFGQVVDQIWKDYGTSGTLDEYDYSYDLAGNVLSRTNTQNTDLSETYTFDGANRLTAVKNGDGTVTKESWTLDGLGNFGSANAANENTAAGYEYDKAGNLLADGTNTYTYDVWNRLVEVDQGSVVLAQYRYDGGGRRIVAGENTDASGGLDTFTDYYYAGAQVVETRAGTSMTSAPSAYAQYQYVWSARGVDIPILRDGYDSNGDMVAADRIYFLTDAIGNVTALVNAGGTVVERYSYSAYGNVTVYDGDWNSQTGSAYNNDRLYTGREYDRVTGLYYNRARWYNPKTFRGHNTELLTKPTPNATYGRLPMTTSAASRRSPATPIPPKRRSSTRFSTSTTAGAT